MKILFIQLGGSIDKKYPIKANNKEFVIEEPAFTHILDDALSTTDNKFVELRKVDSLDLGDNDLDKLHETIKKSSVDKIVVTMGSDKLAEFAEKTQIEGKTIIFTGSALPYSSIHSDAGFNVGMAVATVQSGNSGTFVAMNGKVFPAGTVIKDSEDAVFKET